MRARRVGGFTALRRYLTPYVLAVVLYLPWLPSAVDQVTHNALPTLKETMNLNELGSIFSVLITGLNGSRLPSCVTVILIAMLALIHHTRDSTARRMEAPAKRRNPRRT